MKLQQCQMGQVQGEPWEIRNGTDVLLLLPANLSDGDMINIVEFAKTHEKEAFEEGREMGGKAMLAAANQRIDALLERITALDQHNGMLAEKLEQIIGGDID